MELGKKELIAVRAAIEGIPLAAIARILVIPAWEVKAACLKAKTGHVIKTMPPDEWPVRSTVESRERAVKPPPSREKLEPRAVLYQTYFGLPLGQAMLLAALVSMEFGRKAELWPLVSLSGNKTTLKIVDVLVCKLRERLAEIDVHIQTIWGVGYKLSPKDKGKIAAYVAAKQGGK